MSEPIDTTVSIAVPDWYGTRPVEDDELRQVAEWVDGQVFGMVESGGDPVAGELWQCSGDFHYGVSMELTATLKRLINIGVEFDAVADEYCEWPGERESWRIGWDKPRHWTSTPEGAALTEGEYKGIRSIYLDAYPADYIGFVVALDTFWPPPLLVEAEEETGAVA